MNRRSDLHIKCSANASVYKFLFPYKLAFSSPDTAAKMAFTEFVVPTLKTDPETEAKFMSSLAPFLIEILETHSTPPKHKFFGKILLENGNDVSKDFRLVVGLGSSLPLLFAFPTH
jgi:hypothetical protein